jgi:D-alanyl-D-alanine carboxypeptidase
LEKKITYKDLPEYYDYKQNIQPLKGLENGKTYTFRELIEYMIRYSNNTAAIILQENIDINYITSTFYDLGM